MDFNETHITIAYPTGGGFDSTLYVRGLTIQGTVLTHRDASARSRVEDSPCRKQRYRPKTLSLSNTWVRSIADMDARGETILEAYRQPGAACVAGLVRRGLGGLPWTGPERQGARGKCRR